MSTPSNRKSGRKGSAALILNWIFTVLCILYFFMFLPGLASCIFLCAGIFSLPPLRNHLVRNNSAKYLRIAACALLFVVACFFSPRSTASTVEDALSTAIAAPSFSSNETPAPTSPTIPTVLPSLESSSDSLGNTTPAPTDKRSENLFSSNEIVNSFLEEYNDTADYPFDAGKIEQGNVRNKAIISTNDLYITICGLENGINISIEAQGEPSDSFFPVFRDSLQALDGSITDEQASACWDELQSSDYNVDVNNTGMYTPCMINGIRTGFLHSSLYGEMSRAEILYYTE